MGIVRITEEKEQMAYGVKQKGRDTKHPIAYSSLPIELVDTFTISMLKYKTI